MVRAAPPPTFPGRDPGAPPRDGEKHLLTLHAGAFLPGPSQFAPGPAILAYGEAVPGAAALADKLSRAVGAAWGRSRRTTHGALPCLALACPNDVVGRGLVAALNVLAAGGAARTELALEILIAAWERPAEAALLAAAARRRGFPVSWLGDALVIGQGARARVYSRGFPWGAEARLRDVVADKLATAHVLLAAGIPSSAPRLAATGSDAEAAAAAIGYPVVLKPRRAWAQVGVHTGLRTAAEVNVAYVRALAQAGPLAGGIVLEKELHGPYVRATFVGGRLAAALTARAPVVRGDGRRTILALVGGDLDGRSEGILAAVLSSQGLQPQSIPARARVVRVGLANQGPSRDVTPTLPAATRRTLAHVSRLFPLPLLGVDLIGDRVLEVNAAPAFSLHERVTRGPARDLAPAILAHLFPGGAAASRVPVLTGPAGSAADLERRIARLGVPAGGYTRGHAWIGRPRDTIGRGAAAAQLLVWHPAVEAIALELDPELSFVGRPA